MEIKKLSKHKTPETSPGFLLWHVSTKWRSKIEGVLKPLGMTHPQFVVLAATQWLTEHEGSFLQSAIGKMAGLDPNTISQILQGLEKKGWLERNPSSDGRAKQSSLTPLGQKFLGKALPLVESTDESFFGQLNQEERVGILRYLQKLGFDDNN